MLETDRRAVVRDIKSLEKQLKDVEKTKRVNRQSRKNIHNISLLGYTNAGKSTILNGMMKIFGAEKFVYSDDLLFATLDTSTRRLDFSNTKVTLTDTVGFIDNLSDELNDSFLTTIDEIKFADMLLIVIDASHNIEHQLHAIETAIKDIDVGNKKILYVFNKMDKVSDELAIKLFKRDCERIYISFIDGDILDHMMTNYDILNTEYDEDGTNIKFEISKEDKDKYGRFITSL